MSATMRAVGYPSREVLRKWIDDLRPRSRKVPIKQGSAVSFSDEQKRHAIGAADGHPLSVRRFAPAIQRMERTAVAASKLTPPSAAHPQPRYTAPGWWRSY